MGYAHLLERMFRTTNALATTFADLRVRLPQAYDNGFGTIGEDEVTELSDDLGQIFKSVRGRLRSVKDSEASWAAASAANMSEEELIGLAKDIMDIHAMAEDAVAQRVVTL